jgi:hypothetical protein
MCVLQKTVWRASEKAEGKIYALGGIVYSSLEKPHTRSWDDRGVE